MNRCPIKALESLLLKNGIVSGSEKNQTHKNIEEEVDEALIFAKESPYPNERELLSDVFKA
jgi:TPP-dependent pyruvate/acetoin dehydrogenase alpha subunit